MDIAFLLIEEGNVFHPYFNVSTAGLFAG